MRCRASRVTKPEPEPAVAVPAASSTFQLDQDEFGDAQFAVLPYEVFHREQTSASAIIAECLPLPVAAQLAAGTRPVVNTGTLLAFACQESGFTPKRTTIIAVTRATATTRFRFIIYESCITVAVTHGNSSQMPANRRIMERMYRMLRSDTKCRPIDVPTAAPASALAE
jgi:hypothetical protein